MSTSEGDGAATPTRRLTLIMLVLWLLIALGLPLAALTLNIVKLADAPLGLWLSAVGGLALLALLALLYARRAGGDRSGEGVRPAMSFAGEALGAVAVIGATGAVAALGYDGLALGLGLVAGMVLMAIIIAPRLPLYPVRALGGFFPARFGGIWPRRLALGILAVASVLLLAADVRGGALAVQGLLSAGYAQAVAMIALALSAAWLGRSFIRVGHDEGVAYLLVLIGVVVTTAALAVAHGHLPLPHVVFGYGLTDLAALEQRLVVAKLSDVKSLKPMASPFLQLSMTNFAGLVLAIALGVAAAPHLAGRHLTRASVAPGDAPRRAALAALFVALFVAGVAPFATYARLGFETAISAGMETAVLTPALVEANSRGWLEICSQPGDSASAITAACAKASGTRGFLRLQDVALSQDGFVVAAPKLSGLGAELHGPLLVAALLAALVTGHALVRGLLDTDAEGRRKGSVDPIALEGRSVMLAGVLILAAVALALPGTLTVADLASDGFALLAAGVFPALVLGLYWRRATPTGAMAAMLTGFVLSALYIVAVRAFPADLLAWTGSLSNAPPAALKRLADLSAAVSAAQTEDAAVKAAAALARHASQYANWFGLRPPAIVLLAVPASFAAGVTVSLLTRPPVIAETPRAERA